MNDCLGCFICLIFPLIGLFKGLICVVPCTVWMTIANTLISIVHIPWNFYHTYAGLAKTPQLGPHIRVVILLTVWIPILLTPPATLIGSLLVALVYSLFYPTVVTFSGSRGDCDNIFTSGIATVYADCFFNFPQSFMKALWTDYFDYLKHYRDTPRKITIRNEQGETVEINEPFDIPVYWIPLSLVFSAVGIIINLPAAIVISLFKVIPATIRLYYHMWKFYGELGCGFMFLFLAPFIIANVLAPVVAVLGVVGFWILGIGMGVCATGTAYRHGFEMGFRRIIHTVYELDHITNHLVFDCDGCLVMFKLCHEDMLEN